MKNFITQSPLCGQNAGVSNEADGHRIPDDHPNDHLLPSNNDRERAVAAGYAADEATLRTLATSDDPATRALVLSGLWRAGILRASDVIAGLNDPDARTRRRALELVALTPAPEFEPLVCGLCRSTDPVEAELAAFTLGELADIDSPHRDASVALLEDLSANASDALLREASVAALGALGSGLDSVLRALNDKATVRRRAVISLAAFDDPRADAALVAALDDRDWQVRQAAEELGAVPNEDS